jgi:hypothetical protein
VGLVDELHAGLEEVGVESEGPVEGVQRLGGGGGLVPVVAHQATDDGTVLLLDVGLIVLAAGARACERNVLFDAVPVEGVVDEGAVVIWEEGLETFGADAIGGVPGEAEGIDDLGGCLAPPSSAWTLGGCRGGPKVPEHALAMVAGNLDGLREQGRSSLDG